MKKAFTLVELIIAIALLGIIMTATFAIFATANKNYRFQSQKSFSQKELNFTSDALGNEIKSAIEIPESYSGYTRTSMTLILALPAYDNNKDFIYSNGIMVKDYIIYNKEGALLRKIIIPDPQSERVEKNTVVLTDVSAVAFTYQPTNLSPESVTANIHLSKAIGKNTLSLNAIKTAVLRNKQ